MIDSNNSKDKEFDYEKWHEESLRHWRSWGSWFSWGSPIGLGIWFISLALTLWIVMQAIH